MRIKTVALFLLVLALSSEAADTVQNNIGGAQFPPTVKLLGLAPSGESIFTFEGRDVRVICPLDEGPTDCRTANLYYSLLNSDPNDPVGFTSMHGQTKPGEIQALSNNQKPIAPKQFVMACNYARTGGTVPVAASMAVWEKTTTIGIARNHDLGMHSITRGGKAYIALVDRHRRVVPHWGKWARYFPNGGQQILANPHDEPALRSIVFISNQQEYQRLLSSGQVSASRVMGGGTISIYPRGLGSAARSCLRNVLVPEEMQIFMDPAWRSCAAAGAGSTAFYVYETTASGFAALASFTCADALAVGATMTYVAAPAIIIAAGGYLYTEHQSAEIRHAQSIGGQWYLEKGYWVWMGWHERNQNLPGGMRPPIYSPLTDRSYDEFVAAHALRDRPMNLILRDHMSVPAATFLTNSQGADRDDYYYLYNYVRRFRIGDNPIEIAPPPPPSLVESLSR